MATARRTRPNRHVPRRHCPHCALPEGPPTPSPPELDGQTCTATMGVYGPTCGRPAVKLDLDDRPVCDVRQLQNLFAHTERSHPGEVSKVNVQRGRSRAEPAAPPVARAAQDPPPDEASAADAARSDEPLTLGDARALGVTIADDVSSAVIRAVKEQCGDAASMAQDPAVATHPTGLCDDGKCAPCRSQRRDEHVQARHLMADELDHAIEWKGRGKVGEELARDGSDALGDVLEGWRDAGRPEPAPQPGKHVVVVPDE